MKNIFRFSGIIAAIAIIGFSFAACSNDDDDEDGMKWTDVTNSTFGTTQIYTIAYGGDKFVAGGSGEAEGKMAYSSDGITWKTIGNKTGISIGAIAYGSGKFVVVGHSGKMAWSTGD